MYKKDGTIKEKYQTIINNLKQYAGQKSFRLYLKTWSKSKGHYNLNDAEYWNTIFVLKNFNIKYTLGNDGKFNGQEHDFIEVKVDRRNKFWK